eukprot:c11278_g2_i1.p1 GENE.c11278_g2_i1~~c11278_g2_i1.p1  ORF type:complete len:212 (+),score=27.41 c11278_g2_i1:27-638(+)
MTRKKYESQGHLRLHSKTSKVPRRPFEKERLDSEMKLLGEYGLKNKREIWRLQYILSKTRSAARELLTLHEKHPRRLFEGAAIVRRLHRLGVLDEDRNELDFVLGLKVNDLLERRLQTQVYKLGLAKSVHHARVLVKHKHIRVGSQVVDVPSFMVRTANQGLIEFSGKSPFGGGRPGRIRRRTLRNKGTAEAAPADAAGSDNE